jgi:O-antigen ligase
MISGKPNSLYAMQKLPDKGLLVLCFIAAIVFGAVTAVAGGVVAAMVLVGIVAAGFTLTNYRVGLWFLVLLLPISATTIFPRELLGISGANPYNALFGLTLLSFLAERVWKQNWAWTAPYSRFWWAYLAPIALAALVGLQHFSEIPAFAFSQDIVRFTSPAGYLRDILIKPFTYILLALLLGIAVRDGMKPSGVIVALCLSIWIFAAWVFAYVLLSGYGLAQLASASNREFLGGTGMHANDLGNLAAYTLILMIFAIANTNKTAALRWLYVMTACIAGTLLLISFSRGAFLSFVVGLIAFFIVQRRPGIIVAGLFVLAFVLPLLPVELYERLSTGVSTGGNRVLHSSEDPLTAGRVAGLWMPLLSEVRSHPLFGNGLLSIAWSMPLRSGAMSIATLNPHNMFLKILLEVGAVGFVLVMLFFIDLWRRFRAAASDPATPRQVAWLFEGSAAAMMGYAAFGLSGGDYLPDPSSSLLWIAWGLLLAVAAGRSRTVNSSGGGKQLSQSRGVNPSRSGI